MKKFFVFLLVIILLLTPRLAGAESGKELTENSTTFDGKRITYQGEVIGVMGRGNFAWVNVLDGGFAIGVWCHAGDAKKVSVTGDYRHVGDIVEITGTFHMVCIEHGGDMDIHADNFTVLTAGRELDRSPDLTLATISIVLVAISIVFTFLLRYVRKEREKLRPWPDYGD